MMNKVAMTEVEADRSSKSPGHRLLSPTCLASLKDISFDIFYIITLQLLRHDDHPDSELPLHLSQICHSLRTFAIETPILWSRISFLNPRPKSLLFNEQRLWLQRSGDVHLHIQIKPSRFSNRSIGFSMKALGNIMGLLLPHIRRWESFNFDSPQLSLKGCSLVLDLLRGKVAPELETLKWIVPRGKTQRCYLTPSSVDLPKLHYLELGGGLDRGDVLQISERWSTLRRVELRRIPHWRQMDFLEMACVQQLLALPSLEEMVTGKWQIMTGKLSRIPMVSTPNLQSLRLTDRLSGMDSALSTIGVRLDAPRLTVVDPTIVLTDETTIAITKLPSFPWPRLRRIGVDLFEITDVSKLVRILENLHELVDLDIESYCCRFPIAELLAHSLPSLCRLSISGNHISLSYHARHIAQSRLESPRLASLTYLKLDLNIPGDYSLADYVWFRDHVPEFIPGTIPTSPDQPPTKRPRRRYRKARTKPRWPGAKLSPRNLARRSEVSRG